MKVLKTIKKLYEFKFLKFCTVGGSGLLVNITMFYFLNIIMKVDINFSSIISFIVASLNNYILNTIWTFRPIKSPLGYVNYFKYLSANLTGLILNIAVLNTVVFIMGKQVAIYGQLLGILSATTFNYYLSSKFVFKN
jgi:dolichol-phosphate mannosyltransferase